MRIHGGVERRGLPPLSRPSPPSSISPNFVFSAFSFLPFWFGAKGAFRHLVFQRSSGYGLKLANNILLAEDLFGEPNSDSSNEYVYELADSDSEDTPDQQ